MNREFAIIAELDSSCDMLVGGIAALFPAEGKTPDLDATMQQLAAGLERLLKLTYLEASLFIGGDVPDAERMKRRYGHDVLKLVDGLVDMVAGVPEYAGRPAVRDDLHFIRTDNGLRDLLRVLSSFGQGGRYHRLNALLDERDGDPNTEPSRRWQEIELELLQIRDDWDDIIVSPEATSAGAYEVAGRLQRFVRAVARMWTLGAVGDAGRVHSGVLGPWLYLRDEEIGTRGSTLR